ncbi:MAG: hypothetical protein OEN23_08830 [Paracoccaceae bacterium]|nr:hypothetical protein [Paracoccaceae bacterium]
MTWDGHISTPIRHDHRAEGGLAFFEWVLADPERTCTADPIAPAVRAVMDDGRWAENDVPAIIASLRRGGLDRRHKRAWAALVPALDEWIQHRHRAGFWDYVEHIVEWLEEHEAKDLANVEV